MSVRTCKFKLPRQTKKAGWYHETSLTKTSRVFYWDGSGLICGWEGTLYGPYETFSKAKEHAMQVHRVTYQKARTAMRNLKRIVKPR